MKNKNIGFWLLLVSSSSVFAMQPLDDQSLAATTGQNGLTLEFRPIKLNLIKSHSLILTVLLQLLITARLVLLLLETLLIQFLV